MSGLIRCFVAVDVDEPAIVSRVVDIQRSLSESGALMKLVEPENLHVTLRFIGEVPALTVERIKEELGKLSFRGFTVTFRGLGAFPSAQNPRVVWIGVSQGAEELSRLSGEVNALLRRVRLPSPKEEFVPHLTIARVKSRARALSSLITKLSEVEVGSMRVSSVRLKKSTLTSRGPIYETLLEVPARG